MAEQNPGRPLSRTVPDAAAFARTGCSLRFEDIAVGKLRLDEADFAPLLGFAPPPSRTQIEQGGATYAWLAPGEWLITGSEASVRAALEKAGENDLAFTLDITHGRATFILSGPEARTAIASVSPLDTRDRAFAVGAVARSILGETGMFIARLAEEGGQPQFRIIVDQTMAAYAVRMLGEPATRSIR